MTRPFIAFPIFPPYDHWQPNRVKRFPVNAHVSARLSEVDESCLPFMSAWYADRYLNWIAHSTHPKQRMRRVSQMLKLKAVTVWLQTPR